MDDFDFEWDFSDDDDPYHGGRNSGCLWLTVGLLVVLFSFVWIIHHKRQVELIVFVGLLGGAAYLGRGYVTPLFARRGPRPDASATPTPLAQVKPGSVHTAGLVGLGAPPVHAPLGAPPCVFFRVLIEPMLQPGNVLFEARSADELVLDDGMGKRVVVRLDGARWLVERQHEIISSNVSPDEGLSSYLAERGLRFDWPVRARVMWIAPHELVFVRGVAREAGAAPQVLSYRTSEVSSPLEIAASPDRPVLIALQPIPSKRLRQSDAARASGPA